MLHTGHVRCHQALSHSENEEDAKTHVSQKRGFSESLRLLAKEKCTKIFKILTA